MPMLHLLGTPQYTLEGLFHLENNDDNLEDFSLALQTFDPSTYYKKAPKHIKKCIKNNNRKVLKNKICLDSGINKPFVI